MEAISTTTALLRQVGELFSSLQDKLNSDEAFQSLAQQLGWNLDEVPAPIADLLPLLAQLETSVQALVAEPTLTAAEDVKTDLAAVFAAVKALSTASYTLPFDATIFKGEFPEQLISFLIISYLSTRQSKLYGVLQGIGIIDSVFVPADGDRLAFVRKSFNLAMLADVLNDPGALWQNIYGWQGTHFIYDKLVLVVAEMFYRLGWPVALGEADYGLLTSVATGPLPVLPYVSTLNIDVLNTSTKLGKFFFGLGLVPVLASNGDYKGLVLTARTAGVVDKKITLGDYTSLLITGDADLSQGVGVQFIPGQPIVVKGLDSSASPIQGKLQAELVHTPALKAGDQTVLLRTPGNTELTYESITWKAGVAYVNTAADLCTELKINALRFFSGKGDNDSFLSQVLKNFYFKTDLSVGLSKARGFYFDSSGGLNTKQTKTIKLGPVQLNNVAFAVETVNSFTYLTVASDLVADLGPIKASLSGVGLKAGIKYDANGGDIGPFSTDIAVQGPSGVGITVESDLVTGGGYLFLDAAHHKYAGAATLKLKLGKSDVNLNALGLLQTELPGNPDAYSLLLLITATFTPIQLGLGFTLNGLGGLLGINRAADTAYLRGLVRQGQLDKLLFPANVLDNPADALATVDAAFPATEGRYLIGLMGRLGWGVPTSLLTLDVALLVELPSPVRLLILGVLQASLPSKTNELLKLRADFLGSIDFGAKKIAFDASLSESKILVYSLTGDMAFRLYQGDNPVFLISAGGFHPSFQPPAGADLPDLRRLTLALAQGSNLRLTLASYFAVTSNTVQFGAHLDFYLDLRLGLHVEGHFGLDTLFQFSPFRLLAHMEAGVAIKRGNSELLGIHLSLDVSGPGPWHIWGEASFRIWFVKISVDVDGYIGSAAPAPALPAPDVRTPLAAALASAAAWTVEAPPTAVPGGVVLRPANVADGQLFLDPRGTLLVSQRVAPLGLKLDRYGNGAVAPSGGNYFELLSLTVSGGTAATTRTYPATDTDHVDEAREFFAPDQFRSLSQAERLSLPSFQRLPNGLRLKNLSRLTAGTAPKATRRVVQYERLLRDGAATGTVAGGSLTPLPSAKPGATALGRLARGGTLGQLYQATQPSARAAKPVGWAETTYAVVQAATLEVYQGQDKIQSQVEAEQYRLAQATATDLLVVPTYQLALA